MVVSDGLRSTLIWSKFFWGSMPSDLRRTLCNICTQQRYPLCSLHFMPNDVILTSVVCSGAAVVLAIVLHREVVGHNIGRCISTVYNVIRRCNAHHCHQWLIAKWLGLSVTVRVRVRDKDREWNTFLFSLSVMWQTPLSCFPGLLCQCRCQYVHHTTNKYLKSLSCILGCNYLSCVLGVMTVVKCLIVCIQSCIWSMLLWVMQSCTSSFTSYFVSPILPCIPKAQRCQL